MSNVNRRPGRRVVQMTNAQLDAALMALDHVLNAADYDEQRDFFGNAATVRAAYAAQAELRSSRYPKAA